MGLARATMDPDNIRPTSRVAPAAAVGDRTGAQRNGGGTTTADAGRGEDATRRDGREERGAVPAMVEHRGGGVREGGSMGEATVTMAINAKAVGGK